MEFLEKLQSIKSRGIISKEIEKMLADFYRSYQNAVAANNRDPARQEPLLITYLDIVTQQILSPFLFQPYHEKITAPFDYYRFGLDFLRPLIRIEESRIYGKEVVDEIEARLKFGENVILFSNHQTEPDPQAISLLLETTHPDLARNLIFVAGHRVTTDPLAIPFSMGRNLLCIYSKHYIDHPPEKKREKVHHNQKTMKRMRELLCQGNRCIFVAPSGGRDRPNSKGVVELAPFDPRSIEMFWFLAKHSSTPTHFYPLALSTFDILPPPDAISIKVGEDRIPKSSPIHLAFGHRLNMKSFPGSDCRDNKEKRTLRAEHIWNCVKQLYKKIQK